jgi:N-acetylmuramoyl-L-alanine amidase
MSREINLIVTHCSDSNHDEHDDISIIKQWHLARNFNDVGYHYFIKKDGTVQKGREEDVIGAHVKDHNAHSIGICLSGRDDFQDEQFESLKKLLSVLIKKYNLHWSDVVGHRELTKNKTCPNFDIHSFTSKWAAG